MSGRGFGSYKKKIGLGLGSVYRLGIRKKKGFYSLESAEISRVFLGFDYERLSVFSYCLQLLEVFIPNSHVYGGFYDWVYEFFLFFSETEKIHLFQLYFEIQLLTQLGYLTDFRVCLFSEKRLSARASVYVFSHEHGGFVDSDYCGEDAYGD